MGRTGRICCRMRCRRCRWRLPGVPARLAGPAAAGAGRVLCALDKAEGKGNGYVEKFVSFDLHGIHYAPFTYVADSAYIDGSLQPYEWYKGFVIEGARFHGFPDKYISVLDKIPAKPDHDAMRNSENMVRLQAMQQFKK